MRVCLCGTQWQPATFNDLNRFHTDMYISFLQQLTCNAASVLDEVANHVLNASVCFTEAAWCALRAARSSLGQLSHRLPHRRSRTTCHRAQLAYY